MEYWDGYDRSMQKVGVDLIRREPVPQGLYHLVCEVLVCHEDGSFLLMERADEKESYPRFFEASAAGSALRGETPLACVKRELLEETGLDLEAFRLCQTFTSEHTHYFQYVVHTNCDKDSILGQEGETVGFKWVSFQELGAMMNEGKLIPRNTSHLPYCLSMV